MTASAPKHAPRLLVVEDERSIRQGLCDVLAFRGYRVSGVADGRMGLAEAQSGAFHLIVLDVMLPELDGFSVCRALRAGGSQVPVLMLTAKGAEDDILAGFEAGADDYVTKPFSVREVLARVAALLRRAGKLDGGPFRVGPFEVSAEHGWARSERLCIELSAREVQILRTLAEDPGRIVSRRTLLRQVWGMNNVENVETRTVDMHVAKLRKKLGDEGAALVETVRGQGYRLCNSR